MFVLYLTTFTHSLCAVANFEDIGPPEYEGKMVPSVRLHVWLECMCILVFMSAIPSPPTLLHEKMKVDSRSYEHKRARHPVLVNM